jgi:peptidyl-Lys metalloendopeptidase
MSAMSKNLHFKWLAFGAAGALLLGACAIQDDEGTGSDLAVVDDAVDPAAGDVSVTLAVDKTSFGASERVIVKVTLTNDSDSPIRLLSWYAPSGELEEDLFSVVSEGQEIEFTGPHYKRAAPASDDFVILAPGKSVSREVDITEYYDLSKDGDYGIRYALDILESGSAQPVTLQSNLVNVWVEGRASTQQKPTPDGTSSFTSSIAFSKCTADQQNVVLQGVGAASAMADGASAYLNNTTPSGTPRYTTWFGSYNSNGWGTAKTHFTAIKDALDTKPLTFDCGCRKKYYAYVYPNQPYVVYLCNVFWSAPVSGTDSKGGTIIHELSHFSVVAGTDDWVYGQSGAKSLAISDPNKALNNADSHEYFAENTPALQ